MLVADLEVGIKTLLATLAFIVSKVTSLPAQVNVTLDTRDVMKDLKLKTKKAEKSGGGESEAKGRRITPEQTAEIENLLRGKEPVARISESVGVSNPIVYVIKNRMKKEGLLE